MIVPWAEWRRDERNRFHYLVGDIIEYYLKGMCREMIQGSWDPAIRAEFCRNGEVIVQFHRPDWQSPNPPLVRYNLETKEQTTLSKIPCYCEQFFRVTDQDHLITQRDDLIIGYDLSTEEELYRWTLSSGYRMKCFTVHGDLLHLLMWIPTSDKPRPDYLLQLIETPQAKYSPRVLYSKSVDGWHPGYMGPRLINHSDPYFIWTNEHKTLYRLNEERLTPLRSINGFIRECMAGMNGHLVFFIVLESNYYREMLVINQAEYRINHSYRCSGARLCVGPKGQILLHGRGNTQYLYLP